jgi:aryl-alcohol dehydrogenase-like predicted oxidoreductase
MNVSEIGLGSWQLANPAWGVSDSSEALQIVQKSLEAGCNFFDTAPGYGGGRSEELLGLGLRSVRSHAIICTKFGHTADNATDFRTQSIRPALQASMKRLQTDYLDIVLMHNPSRDLMDGRIAPQYEELEKLKAEGLIRAYGVSLDSRRELELVLGTTRSEAAEVLFNALNQEALPAFPDAQAHGMGLIVKVPLDSGWLSGKYRAGHQFDGVRDRWSQGVIPDGRSMAHAALQFVLAQPQVSTVIPGAKSVAQALENFAAADTGLGVETVQAMRDLWTNEIASDPLPW